MGSGSEQKMFMKKLQWAKTNILEFSFLVIIQHARKMKLTCNFFFSSLPFFPFFPALWTGVFLPQEKRMPWLGWNETCMLTGKSFLRTICQQTRFQKSSFTGTPQVHFTTWNLWKGLEFPSKAHAQNFHASFLHHKEWLIRNSLICSAREKGLNLLFWMHMLHY